MITVLHSPTHFINQSTILLYRELCSRDEPDLTLVNVSLIDADVVFRTICASDLVVVDAMIWSAARDASFAAALMLDRPVREHYVAVWDAIEAANVPVLLIASNWDLHGNHPLDDLPKSFEGIAWPYEKSATSALDVPPPYQDVWMSDHIDPMQNYLSVRSRFGVRIDLPHSISRDEIVSRPRRHIWDVCIAGDGYATRQLAKRSLHSSVSRAPYSRIDAGLLNFLARTNRPGKGRIRSGDHPIRRSNQKFMTRRSKVSFTCGSGYRYCVRKFFEIPANRSCLVAYPYDGMKDDGFLQGVHYIAVNPEGFGAAAIALIADDARLRKLSQNAITLIDSVHTTQKRADDLLACMRLMAKGRLRLARFVEGRFEINP